MCIFAGVCGTISIKNDLVCSNATLALKAFSDGACAVVADSLFHNLTVLGKNENACWSILEWAVGDVPVVLLVTCMIMIWPWLFSRIRLNSLRDYLTGYGQIAHNSS